jgi:hypothetical protein
MAEDSHEERTSGDAAHAAVQRAETADDEARLEALEELYRVLEEELERDVDETSQTRH